MRKHFSGFMYAAFVAAVLLGPVSGCDYVRASLGKPTSADLEKIRMERQAKIVSEVPAPADTADVIDISDTAVSSFSEAAQKRYYAVAGAFKEEGGVQLYVGKLKENGFNVHVFDFKNGLKVVCIEGRDSIRDARSDMAALKRLGLSPSDPWIYNTDQKLHK